jgi:Mlc titration factor MtfA (ptsG expression regulator)
MLGESWQRGSIVLSASRAFRCDATDGQNRLHEFAHHLDSLDGEMGLPPLPTHEAETR